MSDNSSYLKSNNATQAGKMKSFDDGAHSSIQILEESHIAELTTELNNHKLKLSEEVVEGVGVKIEEIGEIIEGTFRDKKIASKFGEQNDFDDVAAAIQNVTVSDTNLTTDTVEDSSPNKRKVDKVNKLNAVDLSSGEVADVEVGHCI